MAISDIDPSTPEGQDFVLNGDNQIRAFKDDVKSTLGGLAGPVFQDADTDGAGGTVDLTDTTMSSWEARIAALEGLVGEASGAIIPIGSIVAWYANRNFPDGWVECNGAAYSVDGEGFVTPDLRGRGIIGPGVANIDYKMAHDAAFNEEGLVILNTLGAGNHSHPFQTPAHVLTQSEMPTHAHTVVSANTLNNGSPITDSQNAVAQANVGAGDNSYNLASPNNGTRATRGATGDKGSNQGHTHPATVSDEAGTHQHLFSSTQTYLAIYHIMFVGPDAIPA